MAPLNSQLRPIATALALCIALGWPRLAATLPITSEPLAYNPADLAWQALLALDTQPATGRGAAGAYRSDAAHSDETRAKVAKSIFITPNFNESASTCKPGWRHDPVSGKCHKVNIQLNQQDLLTMQALQAFIGGQGNKYGTPAAAAQTATVTSAASTAAMQTQQQQQQSANDAASYSYGDSVEYDYDEEIEQGGALGTGAAGPYHVPLTLGFGPDTFSATTAALKPVPHHPQLVQDPFRDEFGFFRKSSTPAAEPHRVTVPATTTTGSHSASVTAVRDPAPAAAHSVVVRPVGSNHIATPVPSTTQSDAAYVVGAPERMVDAGATLAIELPSRQLTTRAALAPTTEMAPVAAQDTATVNATTEATTTTEVVASTTEESKPQVSTTELPSTTIGAKPPTSTSEASATTTTESETETDSTSTDLETAATETVVSVSEVDNALVDSTTLPTEQTDTDDSITNSGSTNTIATAQATETTATDIFADVQRRNEQNGLEADGDRVDSLIRELERESLLHEQETATDATTTESGDVETATPSEVNTDVKTTTVELPIVANEHPIIVSEPLVADDEELTTSREEATTAPTTTTTTTTTTEAATESSTTEQAATKANLIVVTPEPVSTTTTTTTEDSVTPIAILVLAKPPPLVVSTGVSDVSASGEAAVQQHERNEDARERIEQHNRFVYAHLEPPVTAVAVPETTAEPSTATTSTTTTPELSTSTSTTTTTTTSSTTAKPSRPTLIEQLRLINRYAEHNRNRIRFPGAADAADSAPLASASPSADRPSIFVNRRTGGSSTGFRFPVAIDALHRGTGAGRAVEQQQADTEPTASAASSLFSWLPTNWRISASREAPPVQSGPALEEHAAQRKALTFWNSMPLIRDSSARLLTASTRSADESSAGAAAASAASTDRSARANSKSPTEWLFRQPSTRVVDARVEPAEALEDGGSADSAEVFRVLTTKTAHFSNR